MASSRWAREGKRGARGPREPGGGGIAQRLRLWAHGTARPQVHPSSTRFTFRTARQVPRLGVMLVGWGGNNGSTLTAAVLANRLRLSWPTRTGRKVGVEWGAAEARAQLESKQEIGSERMGPQGGASTGAGLQGAGPKVVTGSGKVPPEGE